MISNCPGSSRFRQPKPEIVQCGGCGAEVEIWSDEAKAVCPDCKKTVLREQGQSCLEWCRYAKQCVGEKTYNTYLQNKSISLREKLLKALEANFEDDTKRINHAKKVLHFAEELLKHEKGDWHIVIPASILHDIGIKAAESKYGSSAGSYQEKEGPAIAKKILQNMGVEKEATEEISEIIAHHHTPGVITTENFKILYDADWLVNLQESIKGKDKEQTAALIDKIFLTKTGKELADRVYLKNETL